MLRRRSLMDLQAPAQDWDIAWDYTMGFPEYNGFEKVLHGTPLITMEMDGVHIVSNNDYYVRYSPIGLETCNDGICEVIASFQTIPSVKSPSGFRMILSDGEEGCQISTNMDPTPSIIYNAANSFQKIRNFNYNTDYIFRIERNGINNSVYLDGELIHQSEIASTSYTIGNRVFFQGFPLEATLKSIKFKKIS